MNDSDKGITQTHSGDSDELPKMSLRRAAESRLGHNEQSTSIDIASLSGERLLTTLHELHVHQIELEMQNEELRQTQEELDASRARYFDFYELAPVAYLTLGEQGVILEANLTASTLLGVPRGTLTKLSISKFIDSSDQDLFYFYQKLLRDSGKPQSCELRLTSNDGTRMWCRLLSRIVADRSGVDVLRVAMSDVTEFKQAEIARIENEQRFRFVIEATRDGVWDWNIKTNHVYFSPQWARLLGFEPSEIREHVDSFYKLVHPDDMRLVAEQLQMHFSGLIEEKQTEVRLRTKSGEYRWFLDRGKVVSRDNDGTPARMVGSISDITERKYVESRLPEREGRLRKAQAISKIGNFYWCSASNLVEWSDELYRVYGRNPEQFTPSFASYLEAIHPDDRAQVGQTIQEAIANLGEFDHEYRIVRPDGTIIWVHALGSAMADESGRLAGLEGTCQDITDRRNAEVERDSLQAQLRESQKMEAIGRLAGGIAHDFNNILAVVLGNTEIAIDMGIEDGGLKLCVDEIRKASLCARDLVQQILSFSRRQPTELLPLSLTSVVEESVSLLKAILPARLTLNFDCQSDLPPVLGDKTQLEQVILNLATNAMQAIGSDQGQISIRLDTVILDKLLVESNPTLREIQNRSCRQVLRLSVSDNGPGMSSAIAERIFEPFFTTKPVGEGTGLGLSVVHGIVTAHHGCIVVESKEGQGARFTIYLPATVPEDRTALQPGPNVVAQAGLERSELAPNKFHILLIDDNEAVLQATKRLLTSRGYQVSSFTDQQLALKALRNNPQAFDLLITDYNLPGMSGLSVFREVCEIRPGLPVAVASGFIDEELRNESTREGVFELISKPFVVGDFLEKVQRMLATSAPSA